MAAKKEIDLTGNYGQIKYDVRDKLDLSNNEYLMMDFIATMQGRPSKNNPGYCEASPEYLAAVIGVAKRNYFAICNRLEAKGLLERHPESRKPRVTVMAFDAMKGKGDETSPEKVSDETSPENTKAVTKRHQSGDETSLHYNTVYNTDSFYNTDITANAAEPEKENPTFTPKEKKKEKSTPGSARPPKKEKPDYSQQAEKIISHLNEKSGSRFRSDSKTTVAHISGRLSQGYGVDDFALIVDFKCAYWLHDPKMSEFLRPETLFCEKHFEGYLNAAVKWSLAGRPTAAQINNRQTQQPERGVNPYTYS